MPTGSRASTPDAIRSVAQPIAGIHDRKSNNFLHGSTGTFGFFECLDDEPGILVEGFDTLPAIMEAHSPPY